MQVVEPHWRLPSPPRQSLPQVAVYFLATVLSSALAGCLVAHGQPTLFSGRGVNIGEGMEPFLRWGVTTNYSDKVDSIVRTIRASAGSKLWGWTNHAMCGWGEWNIHFCLQSVFQLTHEGNMPRNGPLANAGLAQKDLRSNKNSMDWW